jgi:membrane protease YdiL (CAAX protease family)
MYGQWNKFGNLSDIEGLDDNWGINALIGLGFGILTIIVGHFVSFIGAIGIPSVQSIAGTVGRFLIIVPTAAIFEEVFFRDFLQDLLESKIGLNKYLTIGIVSVAFSLFHLAAYGNSLSAAGGSFISAAIMGFVFGIVTEKRNSLASSIAYHATLNAWIGFVKLSVIIANGLVLFN